MHVVRVALRTLSNEPLHTASTVLMMAVGLAAVILSFSVLKPLILPQPPFPHREGAVIIWGIDTQLNRDRQGISWPDYEEWRQSAQLLTDLEAFETSRATLLVDGAPRYVRVNRTTANLLQSWRAGTVIGRLPNLGGLTPEAVMSYSYWRGAGGGDRGVLGSTVFIEGVAYTTVGVLSAALEVGDFGTVAFWVPALVSETGERRDRRTLIVTGRLLRGKTLETANSEIGALAGAQSRAHPETNEGWTAEVRDIRQVFVGRESSVLGAFAVFAMAGLIAVASANVSTLLTARSAARQREFATRLAIGAGVRDLAIQLLVEVALITAASWLLALAWIGFGLAVLRDMWPGPPLALRLDTEMVASSLGLSLAMFVACACFPLLKVSKLSIVQGLRKGDLSASPVMRRSSEALVVCQLAISTALVIVLGVVFQAAEKVESTPLGFSAKDVVTARVVLPSDPGPGAKPLEAIDRMLLAARSIAGVQAAAVVTSVPNLTRLDLQAFRAAGRSASARSAVVQFAGDYFAVFGVPVLEGGPIDHRATSEVAVSKSFAEAFGVRVGDDVLGNGSVPWRVAAIVGDVKNRENGKPPIPHVYRGASGAVPSDVYVALRTALPPHKVGSELAKVVSTPQTGTSAPFEVMSLEHVLTERRAEPRLILLAMTVLVSLTTVMAAGGAYALLSFESERRKREIAVRIALGATRRSAVAPLTRKQVRIFLVSILGGVGVGAGAATVVASSLYGANPADPRFMAAITLGMAAIVIASSLIPLRRALNQDPAAVLREG